MPTRSAPWRSASFVTPVASWSLRDTIPLKQQTFYRPLGGGSSSVQRAEDAVRREIRARRWGRRSPPLHTLFTLENIFTYNGEPGHEIVLIFDGQLVDERLYTQDRIPGQETDGAQHAPLIVVWMRLEEIWTPGAALSRRTARTFIMKLPALRREVLFCTRD